MKKIKKIISIGSLSSLLLMPLVAASCKKNDNDEKVQIINTESNPQTSKQTYVSHLVAKTLSFRQLYFF
ncbi:variable surface lipoprotein [Mycoplasmopsis bovis]